jgi:hypothetical protein
LVLFSYVPLNWFLLGLKYALLLKAKWGRFSISPKILANGEVLSFNVFKAGISLKSSANVKIIIVIYEIWIEFFLILNYFATLIIFSLEKYQVYKVFTFVEKKIWNYIYNDLGNNLLFVLKNLLFWIKQNFYDFIKY